MLKKLLPLLFVLVSIIQGYSTTCANAINIPSVPVSNQSVVCGTTNDISGLSCGTATTFYSGGQEALYTFTPATTGSYTVSYTGQTYSSIYIYAGCPNNGGTCVNGVGSGATSKSVSATLTAGVQYYIMFDTWPTPNSPCPGTFSLQLTPPPPANNECTGATALTVGLQGAPCTMYSNNFATNSTTTPLPTCAAFGTTSLDVWFTVVVPSTGQLVLNSTAGTMTDGGMAVYSGTCTALSLLTCDDDSGDGLMPMISLSGLTPGATLYVRFWGYSGGSGTFCLSAYAPCSLSATYVSQTACDPLTNLYTATVRVTHQFGPTTGNIVVNGQSFPIATSPQTVVLTNLPSTGLPVNLTASFSASTTCSYSQTAAWTAPVNCATCFIACPQPMTINLIAGECDAVVSYPAPVTSGYCFDNQQVPYPIVQTAGLPSGAAFPIGSTTNSFRINNNQGGFSTCSFNVNVIGFQNPTTTLACNDNVQVSVENNCKALINADMILEGGPYACYNNYEVRIYNTMPAIPNSPATVSNPVGVGNYVVGVFDASGNNCWGTITVKDKLPPTIECVPLTVACDDEIPYAPAPSAQFSFSAGAGEEIFDYETTTITWDLSNIPASTTVQDLDIKWDLLHTYIGDLQIYLTSPSGTTALVADYFGGCNSSDNLFCTFNDEGVLLDFCSELTAGGQMNYAQAANNYWNFGYPLLSVFDGDQVSGIWTMTIYDASPGGEGIVNDVSLLITFDMPDPSDNCGVVSLTSKDVVENFDCNAEYQQIIRRTWKAVDAAGNSTSCVQTINVTLPDLSTFTWPLNWDGLVNIGNNEMLECDGTYPLDANGNPSPAYTGWPADGDDYCGTLEVFYNDDVYHLACGVKILRNWTVVNDCSGEVLKHVQVIRIDDNTAPTFCAPENLTAKTKAYVCDSDIKVPVLNCLKDNCDAFPRWWVTTNAGIVSGDKNGNRFVDANETWYVLGVPMGTYDLCYHATDNCGNVATYCVKVTVIDGVPPIPVCEQYKQVSLTGYGHAKVFADDYDSGSFDNCNPVYFKVLRVNSDLVYDGGCKDLNGDDNPATATIDVWYDDAVFFCCDDINKEVMVSMRVFDVNPGVGPVKPSRMEPGGDLYGHFNDCWNITYIECKIPPVLTCKPVTITCEESLDPKENAKLAIDVVALCDLDLTYADARDNSTCGANITRTWTAKGCGKTTTCQQAITVVGSTPFDPCTIVFPVDKQVHCTNNLPDGGKPTWDEFPCNVITAEFKDDTFKFVEGSCYKILREWAVIDWCVYKPNVGAEFNVDAVTSARKLNCNTLVKDGYYRYTQVLKVVDLIPPVITAQDQCVGTTSCYAYNVTMTATASDTCNTNEEYWWKYKVENLDCVCEPIQVSYNYLPKPATAAVGNRNLDKLDKVTEGKLVLINPAVAGHYKVTWTVGDGCGNATSFAQYFTIADKKAPTPVMVDLATAVMQNGMVALKARWFDKGGCGDGCISSWDNCTSKDELYFTFSPMIPNLWNEPTKWANQYAQYGKMFFDPATGAISTEAKYLQGKADAWYPQSRSSERVFICDYVEVGNSTKTMPIYVWDQFALDADCDDHNYDFANVVVNFNHCPDGQPLVSGNVQINAMKVEAKYNEGTFTTTSNEAGDYTLGVNANTEYKVSGSKDADWLNGVTTLDLVIIQKFLVGLKSITDPKLLLAADINNNGEITAADLLEARKVILGTKDRFTNNSWIAVNPVTNKRETVVNVSTTNISDVDFVAVKIGDMNNNAVANRNAASVRFMTDDAVVKAGEMVEVPFYAENFDGIYGAQFTMNLGGMSLENVKAGAITLDESNYNVVNGNLIVSFNEAKGLNVADGNVLFTVELKANVDGKLSNLLSINDQVLKSEIYAGKDLDINSIEIGYRNADVNYALYQNEPNPFVGKTTIGFELPTDANYTLTVYDVTGKELKVINSRGVAGYNSVAIDGINTTGVMTYRLQSDDFTATKKMVSIK